MTQEVIEIDSMDTAVMFVVSKCTIEHDIASIQHNIYELFGHKQWYDKEQLADSLVRLVQRGDVSARMHQGEMLYVRIQSDKQ